MRPIRRGFYLFILGFFLGTLGDYFHVQSGTTSYPSEIFHYYLGRQPYWVPLLFGSATLAIGLIIPWAESLLGRRAESWGAKGISRVVLGLAAFLLLYAMSAYLPLTNGGSKDWVLGACALLLWGLLDGSWQGFILGVMTALAGVCFEICLVHRGDFSYLPPANQLEGVATWLPSLYFAASVTVGNFGRYLRDKSQGGR